MRKKMQRSREKQVLFSLLFRGRLGCGKHQAKWEGDQWLPGGQPGEAGDGTRREHQNKT